MTRHEQIDHVPLEPQRRYRALFISDVHLGTRTAQAGALLDFLRHNDAQAIYLVGFIGAYEDAVAAEAVRHGVDGVICGHIHHAADRKIGPVHYLNCGDWIESCTAVVEEMDGTLHVIKWSAEPVRVPRTDSQIPASAPSHREFSSARHIGALP